MEHEDYWISYYDKDGRYRFTRYYIHKHEAEKMMEYLESHDNNKDVTLHIFRY